MQIRILLVQLCNRNTARPLSTSSKEAEQATDSQSRDQTQAHEATSGLPLLRFYPFICSNHACAAQIAVRKAKQ